MDDADEWLDDDVDDLDDQAENAARAEAYQDFLGKVTTNLGMSDTAAVDLAIREALKAMVDERFAAGEISRNNADTLKERIDTSAAPIGILSLGRRMARRRDRRSGRAGDDGGMRVEPNGDSASATPTT